MFDGIEPHGRPRLLVSVRDSNEALTALDGGAEVIDVKEPDHGSLGAAAPATIAEIVRAVRGRVPVTAAAGELSDLLHYDPDDLRRAIPEGVSLVKMGLADCGDIADWRDSWRETFGLLMGRRLPSAPQAVAVVYADWRAANAPAPADVLAAAESFDCPALLVDTWDKATGSLFDHWSNQQTADFVRAVQLRGMVCVLAGSLMNESFADAVRLRPDLVAVRSAACDAGRSGTISRGRVRNLRAIIDDLTTFTNPVSIDR